MARLLVLTVTDDAAVSQRRSARILPPFERVVELHGPAVLRFCMAQVGAGRAEDCFQETMLSALGAYDAVRDPGAIRTWLLSIAARKAIDNHRAWARAPEPVQDIESLAGTQETPLRDEALWAQVRALPDKQRQAVTLRFAGDLTHGEIAVVMQISQAAARRNVFEGLNRLRKDISSTRGSHIRDHHTVQRP